MELRRCCCGYVRSRAALSPCNRRRLKRMTPKARLFTLTFGNERSGSHDGALRRPPAINHVVEPECATGVMSGRELITDLLAPWPEVGSYSDSGRTGDLRERQIRPDSSCPNLMQLSRQTTFKKGLRLLYLNVTKIGFRLHRLRSPAWLSPQNSTLFSGCSRL